MNKLSSHTGRLLSLFIPIIRDNFQTAIVSVSPFIIQMCPYHMDCQWHFMQGHIIVILAYLNSVNEFVRIK